DAVAAAARTLVEKAGGGEVRTVAQVNRSLFSALKVEKIAMFCVLGLVILVAAFNIFGSLVLVTMEKTRGLAVMQSLGATRAGIRRVFLVLGAVIGGVGTAAGLLLGLATCAYVAIADIRLPSEYYLRSLPVEVRPGEISAVIAVALLAALVATRLRELTMHDLTPAEGLRND
ncbi:MAG: ABC transporter permease, partial [Deltaproteobacteria bacterium]|nr:ABC transporter permease [Deltaproteobacteria bacterium]